MNQKINEELKRYIEENVFPQYQLNESGHRIDHILQVINREFQIMEENELDLNCNMVYTIGAYHDIGHHIDAKNHEVVSAEIFMQDEKMRYFFQEAQRKIIEEAIEDHRASLEYEPRSIYGKLVSSADRSMNYIQPLVRTYSYRKKHSPGMTDGELIAESYQHIQSKFGVEGYAKMYFKDSQYEEFLTKIRKLLADKTKFEQEFRRVNQMGKQEEER